MTTFGHIFSIRTSIGAAAIAALASFAASSAQATVFTFFDLLNGANEVPPVVSPASGTLTGTYDDVSKVFSFTYDITSGSLTSPISGGHIHGPGAVGANAPILFDLDLLDDGGFSEVPGAFPQFPTYTATLDLDSAAGTTFLGVVGIDLATFEGHLLSENLYLNIHTEQFPQGEVRGQFLLADVPEPAALTVFGLGLIGLGAWRRRRAA